MRLDPMLPEMVLEFTMSPTFCWHLQAFLLQNQINFPQTLCFLLPKNYVRSHKTGTLSLFLSMWKRDHWSCLSFPWRGQNSAVTSGLGKRIDVSNRLLLSRIAAPTGSRPCAPWPLLAPVLVTHSWWAKPLTMVPLPGLALALLLRSSGLLLI